MSEYRVDEEYLRKLIAVIKDYPQVYNPDHPDFYNKTLKGQKWKEIPEKLIKMGISEEEAKKCYVRFSSLKKRFVKEFQKLVAHNHQDDPSKASIPVYKEMLYFAPFILKYKQNTMEKERKALNNMRGRSPSSSSSDSDSMSTISTHKSNVRRSPPILPRSFRLLDQNPPSSSRSQFSGRYNKFWLEAQEGYLYDPEPTIMASIPPAKRDVNGDYKRRFDWAFPEHDYGLFSKKSSTPPRTQKILENAETQTEPNLLGHEVDSILNEICALDRDEAEFVHDQIRSLLRKSLIAARKRKDEIEPLKKEIAQLKTIFQNVAVLNEIKKNGTVPRNY